MRLLIAPALICASLAAQEPPKEVLSPAQEDAKKAKAESMDANVKPAAAVSTGVRMISSPNPLAMGANLLTGVLSYEIQKRVASSSWAMTMTQKYSATAIAEYLSKREKEPYSVTNSKVENLVVLTFQAKGMTAEKADALFKEGDPVKFRKTGWDRVIYTNGTEAWAFSTEPLKP